MMAPSSSAPKDSDAYQIWGRKLLINALRGSLLQLGAKIVVEIAQRKRLRNGQNEMLRPNDPAMVWFHGDKNGAVDFGLYLILGRT